ncbi:MAG: galactokinase family protein, partial [Candidatus Ornithomonoglobus sp.]
MIKTEELKRQLASGELDNRLAYIYSCAGDVKPYADRYLSVIEGYRNTFGEAEELALFSAPGRTEIGGNHTDHQHGCVLAGSVDLDVI